MADKQSLVDALLGLASYAGDPPRWGDTFNLPAFAGDPPNMLIGEQVGRFASLKLPAPVPLTLRWGTWKPAPFAIPGLTLPAGGGGRFGPDTSAGGITHHDAYRVLVEWGIPNAVQMRQWIGPNAPWFVTAQQLTMTLFRFKRTQSARVARGIVGLGHHEVVYKCVNSTRTLPPALDPNWGPLVGSNWARRGGYVTLINDPGVAPLNYGAVSFSEFIPSPDAGANVSGIRLMFQSAVAPKSVAIPVDWCGPIWGRGPEDNPTAEFEVMEHWVAPPEMEPWGQTP